MRILYIFRSLSVWGGIERILVDKMNYLSEMSDMEVYLLTTDQGTHPLTYTLNKKVQVEDLNICFYRQYQYGHFRRIIVRRQMILRYKQLLADRIRTIRPDIIVCTTADMISCIVEVKGTIPLVVESHSICSRTINYGRNYIHKAINRLLFLKSLKKADVVVALTKGDAKEWKKYHRFVVVIPNMVHLSRGTISPSLSKKVIFVGRFDYQKRVQEAIRIWSIIRPKYPDWVLDIYGDGELKKDIDDAAKRVGGISVNPPTTSIFDCYRESSILISTSLFEPFGLVIPEAMSCGLPIVAYDSQYGPADIISDGVDGFLIKQDDIDAFVEKLSMLMSSHEMRKKMGDVGIQSVHRFDASQIMPLWQNLFQQLNHKKNEKTNLKCVGL